MAEVANCALYIPHITTPKVMDAIIWARENGQVIYAETCPQYLTFTDAILDKLGPQAKMGPPIRTADDREGLWLSIMDGTMDTVASDHAAKPKEIDVQISG